MDPITASMLASLAIKAGVGVVAYLMSSEGAEDAQNIVRAATDAYGNLDESRLDDAARRVLGPSRLAAIQTDPTYRQAGQQALAELKNVSERGGFSLADEAGTNRLQQQTSQRAQAGRQAALEGMRRRGTLDSGDEIVAAMKGQQDATQQESQRDMDVAGQAQNRALEAIRMRAGLAGQMDASEYGKMRDAANAGDERDRYNIERQTSAEQGAYNRELGALNRRYQQATQEAGYRQGQSDRQAAMVAGVGEAAGDAARGMGGYGDEDVDEYGRPKRKGSTYGHG